MAISVNAGRFLNSRNSKIAKFDNGQFNVQVIDGHRTITDLDAAEAATESDPESLSTRKTH